VVERRVLELEDLSPQVKDGWANGTLDRLSLKHLEQLYNGELGVNVATRSSHSVVRGRLTQRAAAEPRDTPQGPSLLRPVSPNQTQRMTGMAWTSVDIECNLHYEVILSTILICMFTVCLDFCNSTTSDFPINTKLYQLDHDTIFYL
jgi:hypothetical protein